MLPLIAASMLASVGAGLAARSAAADMICPDWQYPHCTTSSSAQARCRGWSPRADSPSMVVTFFPSAAESGVQQERLGAPSRWTVQAPHCATPQPYLVPVRPRRSRSTYSSGMSAGAFTSRISPLTVSFMAVSLVLGGFLADVQTWDVSGGWERAGGRGVAPSPFSSARRHLSN